MTVPRGDGDLGLRPLTARSVLASTLLGTHPPTLPTSVLVAAARLFGVSDSAARTALSRLASSGDVVADNGSYRLVGPMLERQQRQDVGRSGRRRRWSGEWVMVVISGPPRSPAERSHRRARLERSRLAELRDGVWVRPDNLDPAAPPFVDSGGRPGDGPGAGDGGLGTDAIVGRFTPDPASRAGLAVDELWDLDRWQRRAEGLCELVSELTPGLEQGDETLLARGFVVSAAVLRLFQRDPLLPDELLPPDWPGAQLRETYDRFDTAYRALLRAWFAKQRASQPQGDAR